MSCLDFPGAIFVGIHDDEQPNGLATIVRNSIPEESIVVELDSGEINCDGNRQVQLPFTASFGKSTSQNSQYLN
jgi:hypothetical protein